MIKNENTRGVPLLVAANKQGRYLVLVVVAYHLPMVEDGLDIESYCKYC